MLIQNLFFCATFLTEKILFNVILQGHFAILRDNHFILIILEGFEAQASIKNQHIVS